MKKTEELVEWAELVGETIRPPRGYWIMYLVLFSIELVFAFAMLIQKDISIWLKLFYVVFTAMFVGGLIELIRGAIVIDANSITVRGLIGTDHYPYERIIETKIEDGRFFLHIASGKWVKMPIWFGDGVKRIHRAAILKKGQGKPNQAL